MPTYEIGDMWSVWKKSDHFLFTGNAIIKNNGALVMGRGMARQVRDRFQNIDIAIGRRIKKYALPYGIVLGKKVGVFQVKHHWMDEANLKLIEHATQTLRVLADDLPEDRFDLNFPGIGNGRRASDFEEIKTILSILPKNVHIWTFR